jgi:hypothetical protein
MSCSARGREGAGVRWARMGSDFGLRLLGHTLARFERRRCAVQRRGSVQARRRVGWLRELEVTKNGRRETSRFGFAYVTVPYYLRITLNTLTRYSYTTIYLETFILRTALRPQPGGAGAENKRVAPVSSDEAKRERKIPTATQLR